MCVHLDECTFGCVCGLTIERMYTWMNVRLDVCVNGLLNLNTLERIHVKCTCMQLSIQVY